MRLHRGSLIPFISGQRTLASVPSNLPARLFLRLCPVLRLVPAAGAASSGFSALLWQGVLLRATHCQSFRELSTFACQGRCYHIYHLQNGIFDRGVCASRHGAAGTRSPVVARSSFKYARQNSPPFGGSVKEQTRRGSVSDPKLWLGAALAHRQCNSKHNANANPCTIE
jgi:hypothetical protein